MKPSSLPESERKICRNINALTAITPAMYAMFREAYESGNLTVDRIYEILREYDLRAMQQMYRRRRRQTPLPAETQDMQQIYEEARRSMPDPRLRQVARQLKPQLQKILPSLTFAQYNYRARTRE